MAIDDQLVAHDILGGAEIPVPQTITDHNDRMASRSNVVVRPDVSSARSGNPQKLEVIPGHELTLHLVDVSAHAYARARVLVGHQPYESSTSIPKIDVVRVGERAEPPPAIGELVDAHQLVRLVCRKRPHEEAVDEAEDRRVRPDPERQRQNHSQAEARFPQKDPDRIPNILPKTIHLLPPST